MYHSSVLACLPDQDAIQNFGSSFNRYKEGLLLSCTKKRWSGMKAEPTVRNSPPQPGRDSILPPTFAVPTLWARSTVRWSCADASIKPSDRVTSPSTKTVVASRSGRQTHFRGVAASGLPQVPVAPLREALHGHNSLHSRLRGLHNSPRGDVVHHRAGCSSGDDNPDGRSTGSTVVLKSERSLVGLLICHLTSRRSRSYLYSCFGRDLRRRACVPRLL